MPVYQTVGGAAWASSFARTGPTIRRPPGCIQWASVCVGVAEFHWSGGIFSEHVESAADRLAPLHKVLQGSGWDKKVIIVDFYSR